MLPLNPLDCRERTFRYGILSPIQPGISPRNLFELRSKNNRELQFLKDKGISPTNLLLCKLNVSRLKIDPMEMGILPEKLLLAKIRIPRFVKFITQSGIHPVNRLFERSRRPKIPHPKLHRKVAGPENLLLERYKSIKVSDEKDGIGPSNWLKLKSMSLSLEYFDEKSGKIPLILLRERFKDSNLELDKFQNQLGIVSEIPEPEISSSMKLF
jgi:hypothetical protein